MLIINKGVFNKAIFCKRVVKAFARRGLMRMKFKKGIVTSKNSVLVEANRGRGFEFPKATKPGPIIEEQKFVLLKFKSGMPM